MSTCECDPSGHLLYSGLIDKIPGAAVQGRHELKPGMDEMLCENPLRIEPTEQGSSIEHQKRFPVHYKSFFTGRLTPDLIHGSGA